ncbi:hypothetical protein Hanom_Chr09g00836961 [Helianthus anomalus]
MVSNCRKEEEVEDTVQTNLETELLSAFDPIKRMNQGFKHFKIHEFKYTDRTLIMSSS